MALKPIIFNTEMVRAILNGRKRQTRRLVRNIPLQAPYFEDVDGIPHACDGDGVWHPAADFCPIQKDDVLYVRETWDRYVDGSTGETVYIYRTHCKNRKILEDVGGYKIKWRPSIHMPKEAARLFLRVAGVRCERLRDITARDAFNEGTGRLFLEDIAYGDKDYECDLDDEYGMAREQFAWLWESTLKKGDLERYGWWANPWVWVIEFERIDKKSDVEPL